MCSTNTVITLPFNSKTGVSVAVLIGFMERRGLKDIEKCYLYQFDQRISRTNSLLPQRGGSAESINIRCKVY
jgi:TnpA family transposase